MKTSILVTVGIFLGIFVSNYLKAVHENRYNVVFEACKKELIENNNYKSLEQAFQCTEKDLEIKILGTLLSSEGSIFRDVSKMNEE